MSLYVNRWLLLFWFHYINSSPLISKESYFIQNTDPESVVSDYINSRGYLPHEKDINNGPTLNTNTGTTNDTTDAIYILSKLSDESLIKLLNAHPKKTNYNLNDIVAIPGREKDILHIDSSEINKYSMENKKNISPNRFQTMTNQDKTNSAYFRLENKQVDPYYEKPEDININYAALQKLSNILYSRPNQDNNDADNDEKTELMFDILVAQLKTLCCRSKKLGNIKTSNFQNDNNAPIYKSITSKSIKDNNNENLREYLFLIINDELRSNGSDEIISVDPNSLEKNSSVLLLGPLTTSLGDGQLKSVMDRISSELSKSEYLPLLQQLSSGTLKNNNIKLTKSLFMGPDTRRYIKPHRCNHQSKLAKTYGGTKWIICTGYLNLNKPSIYD